MPVARALLGITILCALAYALSDTKRRFPYRVVFIGLLLQIALAFFVLRTALGQNLFSYLSDLVQHLMGLTEVGTDIVFGPVLSHGDPTSPTGFVFALAGRGLPAIIFFS